MISLFSTAIFPVNSPTSAWFFLILNLFKIPFSIGLGMITPHLEAGFSGGMKIVLPGVCSARTVDAFHRQAAFIEQNQLGRIDAPLRGMLEQFVAERMPLTFIVNAIVTRDDPSEQAKLAAIVHDLCARFPVPGLQED